jgi:hypothetical protein
MAEVLDEDAKKLLADLKRCRREVELATGEVSRRRPNSR